MKKLKQLVGSIGASQIKMGALFSYLALGINIAAGLLFTPWMVRQIGQANYGLYTLAISLISIFMLDFGLGSAVSRFVSKYRAEGNQDGVNKILSIIYRLYLYIDLVILAVLTILYFFLDVIYVKLTPTELDTFRVLYIMVAGFNLVSFPLSPLNGTLNAHEKFMQLKLCDIFHKLSTVVFVVIALAFHCDVVMVVAANLLSGLATLALKFFFVKKSVPLQLNFKHRERSMYRTLFGFTAWTMIISIMHRFTHSFGPSILGITASSLEIGVYSPAVALEGYFYSIGTAVNGLFLPRISRHIADKHEDRILHLMIKVGRYQLLVLGLIFVGFVCVGQDFMVLWMGPAYAKSYLCALIIMLPTLLSCSQQIAATTVIAKNLIKYQALFMIGTGVVGLAISYVTSLVWGAVGICIGTTTTALANMAYMSFVYRRKAGIRIYTFYRQCWLRALPCYAFVIALCLWVLPQFHLPLSWFGLLIKALFVVAVYLPVFFFVYIPRQERKALFKRA